MNLVEAAIDGDHVVFGRHRVPLDPARRPATSGARVVLGVRPESFEHARLAAAALPRIEARLEVVEELGADAHVFFAVDATPYAVEAQAARDSTLLAGQGAVFTARVDPAARVRVGEVVDLAVDPGRFHFFDPETGRSLLHGDTTSARPAALVASGIDHE
jgi:multiple sugar transport system ATP-binding protein